MSAEGNPSCVNKPPSEEYLVRVSARKSELRAELEELLPKNSDFVWEVGCGHGHFLTAYSKAFPDRTCIGIDLIIDRIRRSERKRDRGGLERLHFFQAEAQLFYEVIPEGVEFSAIYVLFPDPWPKKRHHKNRLMQSKFLSAVALRAKPGVPLYFRTDYQPYFEATLEVFRQHPDWTVSTTEPWPFEYETVFQSRAPSFQSLVARRK